MAISRRRFLGGAATAGIGFGLGAFSHEFPLPSPQVGPDWAPGEETLVPSTCLLCPAHCGIRVRVVDGRPTRIDGNPLHPVSQGGLCAKGCAGLQMLYHPARLGHPLQRVGPPGSDEFKPCSWDTALARLSQALTAARTGGGSETIQWLVGDAPGVMGELITGFCRGCGGSRVAVDDYRDGSADVLRMCQGIDHSPAFDLAGSELVLSFGAGLAEAWWALPVAARARDGEEARTPRWIQVDVRLSRSAAAADEWVAVRPGTYGTLAMGLAYVIVKEGLCDPPAIAERVSGWEDWTDAEGRSHVGFRTLLLRHGRPDRVSALTGVPVATLTALAKAFGNARRAVALWDQGVAWRTGGLADALAIHALNTLTGRLNRPGGLLVQPPAPTMPGPLDGLPATSLELSRSPLAAATWPERDAPPQVLFLYRSNPVASAPKSADIREAIARVPLVVSFSPFLDETARYAHLVLPDHTYLERWQDAPSPPAVASPVWGVVQPVVKPIHDTRATGDVILQMATRLGGALAAWSRWPSMEALVHERGAALAASARGSTFVNRFRQRELRELQARGFWLPHGQPAEAFWESILASGGWFDPIPDAADGSALSQHPDGRVWVFPQEARTRLEKTALPLAEGFLPIPSDPDAPAGNASAFPLQLLPFRVMTLASGDTPLMPWLLEHLGVLTDSAWETWVEVHPSTAKAHGLRSGDRVNVESDVGAFEATVRVFAGVQPDAVNAAYGLHSSVNGWGSAGGGNPLAAIGRRVDDATGLPDWYSTRVRLVRL